jgi:tetratricopeptide (TPR) repeat protein
MSTSVAVRTPALVRLSIVLLTALVLILLAPPVQAQTSLPTEAATRIPQYRRMIEVGERTALPPSKLGYLWALLASSYQDADDENNAIDAYQRALHLLANESSDRANYAAALDNLGSLYLEYGRTEEAEATRKQVLALRKQLGNPFEIARSEQHLAEAVLARHRYKEAEQGARTALETLAPTESGPHPYATTELAALVTLSYAECMQSKKQDCLQVAERADRLAIQAFQPGSLQHAHTLMALGFAQSKNKAPTEAERNMLEGIQLLRERTGETSPIVTEALFEYRGFLKSQHRDTDLEAVDKQLNGRMPIEQTPCPNCKVSVYALR